MRLTPTRYALWSMLAIAPAFLMLPAFSSTLADLSRPIGPDTGWMALIASTMLLIVTAAVAPGVKDPKGSMTPWSFAAIVIGLVQLLGTLFGYGVDGPQSVLTGAYLPGVLLCLNLGAVILMHAWVASAGMDRSPAVGLLTGGAMSAWTLRLGVAQSFDGFVAVSLIGLAVVFTAALIAVFTDRAPAPSGTP